MIHLNIYTNLLFSSNKIFNVRKYKGTLKHQILSILDGYFFINKRYHHYYRFKRKNVPLFMLMSGKAKRVD